MVHRRAGDRDPHLSGRIGAFRLHALHDPRETTRNARKAFFDSFERAVDPHGLLPEEERRRRASFARRAHFAKLARLSALARSRRRRQG
jgi:hypothetical protein